MLFETGRKEAGRSPRKNGITAEDVIQTGQSQLGPRWGKILDPESRYRFTEMHQLNGMPMGTVTVLRLTMEGQRVGGDPVPGNLCPFLKLVTIILPLISV